MAPTLPMVAGPGLPQAGLEVIFVLSILKLLALCRNAATLLIQNKQGHGSIGERPIPRLGC